MRINSAIFLLFIMLYAAPLTTVGAALSTDNMSTARMHDVKSTSNANPFNPPIETSAGKLIFHRNEEPLQQVHPKRIVEHRLIRPQPDMHSILSINLNATF